MHDSIAQILEKLNPYWHLLVRRPLSESEIHGIETDVGLAMPTYLREYLQRIGLFQDFIGGEIEVFSSKDKFAQERNWLLDFFGEDSVSLFPIGIDGAGNVFVVRVDDLSDDSIFFADHETLTVEKWDFGFTEWLARVVDKVLENIEQRPSNSEKYWHVTFSFSEVPLVQIVSVLQQVGVVEAVDANWSQESVSPSRVRLSKLSLEFEGERLEIKRHNYRSWETPILYIDMRESLEVPVSDSKIRRLDALFREHMPNYTFGDYGPLWI